LGIGDWGLGPIPNPQSPIPNPQSPIPNISDNYSLKLFLNYLIIYKMKESPSIIKYLYFSKNKRIETEKELKIIKESWGKLKRIIDDKKFKKIKRTIKLKLSKYFEDEKNKKELLRIFSEEIYEYIKQKTTEFLNEENIKNKIYYNDEEKNKLKKNEMKIKLDDNIKYKEIKKEKEDEIKFSEKSKKTETDIIVESNYIYDSSGSLKKDSFSFLNKNPSKYIHLFKFIKLIGKHENRAEFIKEVGNDILISGGSDKKLIIYNSHFNKISEIKEKKWIYNISIFEKNKYNPLRILI
jgi:hypothetical protein